MWSFQGAFPGGRPWWTLPGITREPGIQEHRLEKSRVWPVFMGSGPGPDNVTNSNHGSTMPGVEGTESELRGRLTAILRATPPLMQVLSVARRLYLPDWLVFSGAVYQPVLNHLTGRPLDYGIKDYDLAYIDASDLSYEAEDAAIRRVRAAFDEPLRSMLEVRNQARVHLWFEARFGEPYTPLSSTAEALERFASATFAIGVRLEPDERLHVEAPFGLADLFALRPRPNPRRKTVGFARAAADVRLRWPELVIDNETRNFSGVN
jgi:uncharacterized protein